MPDVEDIKMFRKLALSLVFFCFASFSIKAQTPAPIVVQAANQNAPVNKPAPVAPVVVPNDSSLKTLGEIKAANEAILSKQAATLEQLDEMQKAAEQLRIYSKRG